MDGSSNVHRNRVLEHLLWNVDGPDHSSSEHLLFAAHQLLEEVDCDVIIRRQKDPDVCGQEVVDLALAPVLRCELL